MIRKLIIAALMLTPSAAYTQSFPESIPAPGGAVIIPSARDKEAYNQLHYAPMRRVGDIVYLSGVVMGPRPGEGHERADFEAQVRRGFERIKVSLDALGVGFDNVVMINSFHVWDGPGFRGTRLQQYESVDKVRREFMTGPHPAWTAVGTSGLIAEQGVLEMQMIVYAPQKK